MGICRGDNLVWLNIANMPLVESTKIDWKTHTISGYMTGLLGRVVGKVGGAIWECVVVVVVVALLRCTIEKQT